MPVRGVTKNVAMNPITAKDMEPIETFIPYQIDLRNGHLADKYWEKRPGAHLKWTLQPTDEEGVPIPEPPPDTPPEPPPEELVCETAHIHVPDNAFAEGTALRGDNGVVYAVGQHTGDDLLIVYKFLMQTNEISQEVMHTDALLTGVESVDIDANGVIYIMQNSATIGGNRQLVRLNMSSLLDASAVTITESIAGLAVDKYQDSLVWIYNTGAGTFQVHGHNKSTLARSWTAALSEAIYYICGDGLGNVWAITADVGETTWTLRKIEPDGDLGTTKSLGALESDPMITYDEFTNSIIIGTTGKIRKYDITTDTVSADMFTSSGTILIRDGTFKNHPIDGLFWVVEDSNFTLINLSNMQTLQQIQINNFVGHDDPFAYAAVFQMPLDNSIVATLADTGHNPQGIDHICIDDITGSQEASEEPPAAPPEAPDPEDPPAVDAIWVATTGNDANPGTEASPKLTIAAGLAALAGGDTLMVKNGTYAERIWKQIPSGVTASYTIVKAENALGVTLRPTTSGINSTDFGVWIYNRHYIVLDGFVIDGVNIKNKGMLIGASNNTDPNLCSNIIIRNCEIKNNPGLASSPGTGNGINTGRSSFVTISNCEVHDCGSADPSHGIYITGTNNVVEDCEVYNVGDHGIHQFHQSVGTDNDNIIRNNYIHDCGSRGIILGSGDNNVAHHNIVSTCGTDVVTDGIKVDSGTPSTCKVWNNTVYNQNGQAITIAAGAVSTQVKNNLCLSNLTNTINDLGTTTDASNNVLSTDTALVVNVATGDFTPAPASSLIDAGVDVGLSFNGAAPDVGGVES